MDDGQWHHAFLSTTGNGTGTTQTLTVDSVTEGSHTSALKLQGDSNGNTHLTSGAGYMGGNWPAEPNQGNTSTLATSKARSPPSPTATVTDPRGR